MEAENLLLLEWEGLFEFFQEGTICMAQYTTKNFGSFEADDKDEALDIETFIEQDGKQVSVSVMVTYFDKNKDEILQLLDKYQELNEGAKLYIANKYPENNDIIDFLFNYAGSMGKLEYKKSGNKTFSIDIDKMITKLEPPSMSFQKYRSGKIMAVLVYYCPDFEECTYGFSLHITIDRNCEVHSVLVREE